MQALSFALACPSAAVPSARAARQGRQHGFSSNPRCVETRPGRGAHPLGRQQAAERGFLRSRRRVTTAPLRAVAEDAAGVPVATDAPKAPAWRAVRNFFIEIGE
jgi:hypothetical protein